ncbi:MAG: hypothetical protein ABSB63_12715 [Spirochaetia bacterium]|jgi:predicted acylesterase/phospholipase RssA
MRIAIACASGSAKGVFIHGVLSAFGDRGLAVDAYAASSSSTVPAAFAAAGRLNDLNGPVHWQRGADILKELKDVSEMVKRGVSEVVPTLTESLFLPSAKRFIFSASHLATTESAEKAQGDSAKRLGLDQLRAMKNKDSSWAETNLACHLFDTKPNGETRRLTVENLADAMYATTRMLHAWKTPGWIDGKPYVDASYTCMCPAIEMVELGYDHVIAISPESGPFYRDLYQVRTIPGEWNGARIFFIQPDFDLKVIGVDYLSVQEEGLRKAFALGRDAGFRFLDSAVLTSR